MNELQYTIALICQRRQVTLQKVESVYANFKVSFGLASATDILPAVANTFYLINSLTFGHNNYAGVAYFSLSPNGGPSAGGSFGFFYKASNNPENLFNWETDYLVYNVNTHSAGDIFIFGQVFKVTYE